GTGKRAKTIGRPIAGKTGTSNQARDAWFAGYSTDVACVIWTGFDDAAPLGAGEMGATTSLPAFVDFMKEAHKKRPVTDFPVPGGLAELSSDREPGHGGAPDEETAMNEFFWAAPEPSDGPPREGGGEGGEARAPPPPDAGAPAPAASAAPPAAPPPF